MRREGYDGVSREPRSMYRNPPPFSVQIKAQGWGFGAPRRKSFHERLQYIVWCLLLVILSYLASTVDDNRQTEVVFRCRHSASGLRVATGVTCGCRSGPATCPSVPCFTYTGRGVGNFCGERSF